MTNSPHARWLSLIGIGEDGFDALSPAACALLAGAVFIVGGKRHLAMIPPAIAGKRLAWPSSLTDALPAILARRGAPVCVLASGDPFQYGIGTLLMQHVNAGEMVCLPAPSAFSLAAARLGWSQQDCALLSLHGRALERILPVLQPGRRILALSWDGDTPRQLAALLVARGMSGTELIVLEAMGGPRERMRRGRAESFAQDSIDPLNVVALQVVAGRGARVLPLTAGLPDNFFEHDGQITKREIRAITLAALAPRHGEMLWDIGAGSGSVGIEWMLRDPANRAIAVERDGERAARVARNATALGVPDLRVEAGEALAVLPSLPPPDAIFIGGGAGDPALIDAALAALRPGARLVINAVTLETQAVLTLRHKAHGGALRLLQVSHAEPVGHMTGWRAAMPVTQWEYEAP